jgi:hypothetical protein
VRRALSAFVFKLARGCQSLSLFFGGISALGVVVALVMLIFNPNHGAAHYGDLTVRRWLWVFPLIALAAWLIGFRLLPSCLGWLAVVLLPSDDRAYLAEAVDVTGTQVSDCHRCNSFSERGTSTPPLRI